MPQKDHVSLPFSTREQTGCDTAGYRARSARKKRGSLPLRDSAGLKPASPIARRASGHGAPYRGAWLLRGIITA